MFNILNFPAIRFRKSDISHESLKKIFIDDEANGQLWKRAMINAVLLDDYVEKSLLSQNFKIKFNYSRLLIDLLISEFTLDPSDEKMIEYYKNKAFEYSFGFVKDIQIQGKVLLIKTQKGDFEVRKLTDVYPEIKSENFDIKTKERFGKCHDLAVELSKKLDIKNKVATGYIAPFSKRSKSLHSWIGVGEYVIDATMNAVISKRAYYMIRDILSPVYKISSEIIKKESEILNELAEIDPLLSKLYLSNRHQALMLYEKLKKDESERSKFINLEM